MITHAVVQRNWFIQAMLAGTGGRWPDLEELLTAVYRAYLRPGDAALDVGVNRGLHLVRLAELVGPDGLVVGVEAVPAFAAIGRDRLAGMPGDLPARVVLHECAVGAAPGRADFFVTGITDGGLSGLKLRPVIADDAFEKIAVEVRTLDSLLPARPVRFAKIDIEGGEYDALRGAPRLLAQRPLIAFEFDASAPGAFGYHADDFLRLLTDAGYRVHDLFGFPVDHGDAMVGAQVWNFLAIPPELDPDVVTAPARAMLEADNPALAALAPSPPPPPELVEAIRRQGGFVLAPGQAGPDGGAARPPAPAADPRAPDGWLSPFKGSWIDRSDWRDEIERRALPAELRDDLRHFGEQGFVVFEGAADPHAIERFQAAVSAAFREGHADVLCQPEHGLRGTVALTEPVERLGSRVVDAYVPLPAALDLLATPRLIAFLTTLFEEEPLLFQSLSFDQGSQQGLHRDTAYVVVDRPHELAACWIALEDVAEGSGELMYVPGSHRDPAFLFGEGRSYWRRDADGDAMHDRWASEIRDSAAARGTRPFTARRGDILVWHAALAHGGAPVRDTALTRQSLVGHFCPLSARPLYLDRSPERATIRTRGDLHYASSYYDLAHHPAE